MCVPNLRSVGPTVQPSERKQAHTHRQTDSAKKIILPLPLRREVNNYSKNSPIVLELDLLFLQYSTVSRFFQYARMMSHKKTFWYLARHWNAQSGPIISRIYGPYFGVEQIICDHFHEILLNYVEAFFHLVHVSPMASGKRYSMSSTHACEQVSSNLTFIFSVFI